VLRSWRSGLTGSSASTVAAVRYAPLSSASRGCVASCRGGGGALRRRHRRHRLLELDPRPLRVPCAVAPGPRELARVVRPGGRLLVTLDNRATRWWHCGTQALSGLWRRLGLVPYFRGRDLRASAAGPPPRAGWFESCGLRRSSMRRQQLSPAGRSDESRRARCAPALSAALRGDGDCRPPADGPLAAALAVRRAGPVTRPRSCHSPFGSPVAGL